MRKLVQRFTAISLFTLYGSLRRYEVLSDSQKRSVYDARGEAGLNESGGMGGMDAQVRFATAHCHSHKRANRKH